MVKNLIVGIVAVAVTIGSTFATLWFNRAGAEKKDVAEKYEHLKLDAVSVPILRRGKVEGYVLARLTATVKSKDVSARRDAVTSHFSAAAFRTVYEEPSFEFRDLKKAELVTLAKRIGEATNKSLGSESIKEVMVENLNYLSPEEVRRSAH